MVNETNIQYKASDKSNITRDWEKALGTMKKYKNLEVINRIGPLVVGIYLKMSRQNTYYMPTYFVHNLCREFPCFTSTLNIKGKMIVPQDHRKLYLEECEALARNAYISLSGDLRLNEVIEGYERYFLAPNFTSYIEFEDLALVCGWSKNKKEIEIVLDLIYQKLKLWPEERYFLGEGGFDNWFSNLEKRVWDSNFLRKIVEEEITKHKLEKFPERNILM